LGGWIPSTFGSGGWRHHAAGELLSLLVWLVKTLAVKGTYYCIPGWFGDRYVGDKDNWRLEKKLMNLMFPL
jgi:hypothetical protein